MNKIESFKINHDILEKGLYVSRIDGDIITLDIRMRKPNCGDYLKNAPLHTIEHIFATFVRNSEFSDSIVYFGPMGCRTGCYLLVRDSLSKSDIIRLVYDAFSYIASFEGEIPGNTRIECGNHLDHDLEGAKDEAKIMLTVLKEWKEIDMEYKQI